MRVKMCSKESKHSCYSKIGTIKKTLKKEDEAVATSLRGAKEKLMLRKDFLLSDTFCHIINLLVCSHCCVSVSHVQCKCYNMIHTRIQLITGIQMICVWVHPQLQSCSCQKVSRLNKWQPVTIDNDLQPEMKVK